MKETKINCKVIQGLNYNIERKMGLEKRLKCKEKLIWNININY